MNVKDLAGVFDTIMSIPGMNDNVKIDLKISRKNALLLNQVIRKGLNAQSVELSPDLIDIATKESKQELLDLSEDCLQKAGLVELHEKLQKL